MTRVFNNIYRALRGTIKRDTGKAILFVVANPDALVPEDEFLEEWLPTSQINSITTHSDGSGEATIMVSEWILKQKGEAWKNLPTSPNPLQLPKTSIPKLPSVPPAKHWSDMDDDIPF